MRLPARISLAILALSAAVAVSTAGMARAADDTGAAVGAGTISGRVVDAGGQPVAGAKVRVLSVGELKQMRKERKEEGGAAEKGKEMRPKPAAKGETGSDGTFTLSNVPAGKYRVLAGLKGTGVGLVKGPVVVTADQTTQVGDVQLHEGKHKLEKAEKPATQPAQ